MAINPAREAQIDAQRGAQSGAKCRAQTKDKVQVGDLLFDEAPTEVLTEYFDYRNVFWRKTQRNFQKTPE